MRRTHIALFVMLALLALTACTPTATAAPQPAPATLPEGQGAPQQQEPADQVISAVDPASRITVTGVGSVEITPDVAIVELGVTVQDKDPKVATEKNNTTMQAVMDALREMGIEEKNIATRQFSAWTQQVWEADGNTYHNEFVVTNTVSVRVTDTKDTAAVLQASMDAGANVVNSVRFELADMEQAYTQARKLALENAQKQAAEVAQQTDLKLGKAHLVTVSNGSQSSPIPYAAYDMAMGKGGAAAPAISQGTQSIQVIVTVEYFAD